MKPLHRLLAFALLLGAVFAVSALAGDAVDPETDTAEAGRMAAGHGGEDEAAGHASAASAVKGLSITDGGYTLELADRRLPAGDTRLAFRILGEDGAPLRDFAVEHERRMHLIVVRRDNSGFQHLHPRLRGDGTWETPIRFAQGGAYRVFADFKTGETPVTLGADLSVAGPAGYRELPAPSPTAEAGPFEVTLDAAGAHAGEETALRFEVTRDGRPVQTQPYLGAAGHLVALRDGDLAFLHTHPAETGLAFEADFPTAGRYRLYLQFQVDGEVHTAAFTQEVAR